MPELPEVEVVRRTLEPRLTGRRIERVEVLSPALREPLDRQALEALAQSRVIGVRRRAKYLWLDVDRELTLALHLGMSGRLTVVASDQPVIKHEHLALHLETSDRDQSAGVRLRLVDPRRFGQAFVVASDELASDRHFAHLGVEPLSSDFGGEHLAAMARGRRGPIKSFLMDGRVVVGVGNIYASEALWLAKVHPKRSVARIGAATWQRLSKAVQAVLARAIDEGGTTLNDFTDGDGNAGYFQVSLAVYDRQGESCSRCAAENKVGGVIRRIVQSNRSTYYCPRCQH